MSFVLRRRAARVACFDPHGRIVLIRAIDPADATKPPWWELPGGGLEGDESHSDTCARELREEVGITDAMVGPCVWTQHAQFRFAGWDFDQHERIHIATCRGVMSQETQLEAFEAMAFQGARWWVVDELLDSDEPTVPPRLREFIAAVAAGERPDPPIDITPLDLDLD